MAYLGEGIRKLGFGMLRLPKKDGQVDLEQTKQMVDLYMDAGFTYFDTAWVYAGNEEIVRKALVERYPRESFQVATKLAVWPCRNRKEAIAQFDTSLARTGLDYFDFYLLHSLGKPRTQQVDEYGLWDFVLQKKKEGLVKHVGFSFHSTPEELDELLTRHPEMEFVQLQINYGDWESPSIQSRGCYEVARRHQKPIIIMEPVKGGMLSAPPEAVAKILKDADPTLSPAHWALRFAFSLEGVLTVLSGMGSLQQMKENLDLVTRFTGLTEDEKQTLKKAGSVLNSLPIVPCTSCNYCADVCPKNVGVSGTFTVTNNYALHRNLAQVARQMHTKIQDMGDELPTACIKCGKCEQVCPQRIPIRKQLEKASALFAEATAAQ